LPNFAGLTPGTTTTEYYKIVQASFAHADKEARMNTELRPNERRVAMHRNDLATFVLLCGLLLAACTPATLPPTPAPWPVWEDQRDIPFQTIDVDNDSRPLLPESAGGSVAAGHDRLPTQRGLHNAYMVFALLRGQRNGDEFCVFIERVAAGKGGVRVYAQFRIPVEGRETHPSYTFPYHIVKVKLSDLAWHGWIAVDLLGRLCDDDKHPC
jgi:hypothetical protein